MSVLIFDQVFAKEVQKGLSSIPKRLPTRFIYDDQGSKLFEEIMKLPEYYLTNSEMEIIKDNLEVFSEVLHDEAFNLVELGAGNGEKTKLLLSHFSELDLDFTYFPIDISRKALDDLENNLNGELTGRDYKALVMDYFDGLNWLKEKTKRRNLVLFMGANIGNFDLVGLHNFLYSLYNNLNGGDIAVIGFDLVKDYRIIERAYNDSEGVTAAFTLNLLSRINRELGADFDLDAFEHYNYYNPVVQANEAYLVSKKKQNVYIEVLNETFVFDSWEPVHVEYSYKYTGEQISNLANYHGFKLMVNLYDSKEYFCDSIWQKQ